MPKATRFQVDDPDSPRDSIFMSRSVQQLTSSDGGHEGQN
jgi:hypothetical protein